VTRFRSEISEQPGVAARLLARGAGSVARAAADIRAHRPAALLIAARGSSDHAATYAKYLFEIRNGLPVALAAPSTFTLYRHPPHLERLCVLGISQSGASPDIVAVLREARRQGSLTIAITNDARSPLARQADHVLRCQAGPERSVPASKTYTASLLLLAMLSQALRPQVAFARALSRVPVALETVFALEPELEAAATTLRAHRLAVLGRGFHLATAEEVALKITEASYIMAEAQSVADFMHGPVAVVGPGFPILLLLAHGPTERAMVQVARALARLGARVLILADRRAAIPGTRAVTIRTGLPEALTPLPFAVAGQLLAFHLARQRLLDPDRPRGLRKVTITR
jgi:glucosamine--fructose-6-phosphate aminotransferase (isomerizing)